MCLLLWVQEMFGGLDKHLKNKFKIAFILENVKIELSACVIPHLMRDPVSLTS